MDSSKATALRLDGPHESPPSEDGTSDLSEGLPPDSPGDGFVPPAPPDATDNEATVNASLPPHEQEERPPEELPSPLIAADHPAAPAVPVATAAAAQEAPAALLVGIATPAAMPPPLEERVCKLEAGLAELQDTRQLESRVAAKVTDQITHELAPVAGTPPSAGLAAIGKRLLGMAVPPPPRTLSPCPAGSRPGWLLWEMLAEARVILRMYTDPRYRMTWVGRVVPLILLVAFLGGSYVVSLVPILGPLLVKIYIIGDLVVSAVQLVIAYALFKVLSHEARRYRELSPDLPASLRL